MCRSDLGSSSFEDVASNARICTENSLPLSLTGRRVSKINPTKTTSMQRSCS
jgi:hypothetical protein